MESPVLKLEGGAFGSRAQLLLKLELLQHTGSFKPRGAFNRILASSVPQAGTAVLGADLKRSELFWAIGPARMPVRRCADRRQLNRRHGGGAMCAGN